MAYFTEQEISEHCFNAVLDAGKHLQLQKRVNDLHFIGNDIIGQVKGEPAYRVVISREGKLLRFSCNCGFSQAGACEHVVAVMFAANAHTAIQIGINWDEPPATPEPIVRFAPATGSNGDTPDSTELTSGFNHDAPVVDAPPEKPVIRLYLTEQDGMLLVEVRFAYFTGSVEFSRSDNAQYRLIASGDGQVFRVGRLRGRETSLAAALVNFELMQYQTGYYTPSIDPRVWTLQQLPQLAKEGYEIYGQEQLVATQARKTTPRLAVSIHIHEPDVACRVTVSFDGIPATLAALVASVKQRSRFVLLADGSSGVLPQRWLDTFAALFSSFDVSGTASDVTLGASQIGLAEALYDLADERSCDAAFRGKLDRVHSFRGVSSQTLPAGFLATLRPYQHAGFEWFYFLKEFGFGGCLADDMGLGKTIQTLALLLKEKENNEPGPSLIVVPNSLLFNWQREAKQFAPALNILTYHGASRHSYRSILSMADVVLTTYGTVIRDCEDLGRTEFHYIVLDEAQAIKNPGSQVSKAVRSLYGRYRIALSGTPIENNLSELWSLFSFINPGMFGAYRHFLQQYIRPIERDMNETMMELLRRLVYPFILRRTKAQVVKELPPKNEMVVYTDMLPRQRTLYDITRQLYHGKILATLDTSGVDGCRMQLLEGLLRLRQICSHPQLYDPTFTDDSGKFLLVDEMLQDAVAEGHRVLVFSQFVTTLEMLRTRLMVNGIKSELLTGSTADRQSVVDRFQKEDGAPVFLISLKAGGTGLNLTAADYVFHIDPWWNPSAENQASDRAYRIGQTRSVFVYKMITRDSIEERVLELQERKRGLMSSIIVAEESFFKQLTREDMLSLFE